MNAKKVETSAYPLLFILFFLIVQSSFAQYSISGRVVGEDGKALISANIFLPELNKGSCSDINGYFELHKLPKGIVTIQLSYIGYHNHFSKLQISSSMTDLEFVLKPAVVESQEVVISGGHISAQHENAVKIEVLKKETFELDAGKGIMYALAKIPGVDMISKGQGVVKPVIRGLSMNDILILNNQVRIENYQYGENHPLGIDANQVDRIEIIKGPAALLYGSDAIGGVLNFIRENPPPIGQLTGDLNMNISSNTGGFNTSLGLKGASKNIFGGLRVGFKSHADFLMGGGDFAPNTRFQENTISAYSGFTGRKGVFKLNFDRYKQDLGMLLPASAKLIDERGRKNEVWYQDLTHTVLSSQNKFFLNNTKLEFNFSAQEAYRKLITSGKLPEIEMKLNTLGMETKLEGSLNVNRTYVLGMQAMLQKNRNQNDRTTSILPNANMANMGFFALYRHSISNSLNLQAGARYDLYNLSIPDNNELPAFKALKSNYSNVSASLGATLNLSDRWHIRSNVANAFRVPNLSELSASGIHGNRYEEGNPDLIPQLAIEYDVSLHFHGLFLSFDAALFYNRIQNYIYLSPSGEFTPDGLGIFRYAQHDAKLYGGEGSIHFHPTKIPWLHLESRFSKVTGRQENKDYLPFIPASKWQNEIRFLHKGFSFFSDPSFGLSILHAFEQRHPSVFESESEGYTILNVKWTSKIKFASSYWKLAIGINNLLDTQYIDHLSTLKELNYYGQGRDFYLSFILPINF